MMTQRFETNGKTTTMFNYPVCASGRFFLMMKFPWVLLPLLSILFAEKACGAKSYNVLVLGPIGSRSLYHLIKSLSEALGDASHSVTLVSSFGPSSRHSNVTEIPTEASLEHLEGFNIFEMRSTFSVFTWLQGAIQGIGHDMWSNDNMKRLWLRRKEFDAIVIIGYINEIAAPFLIDYEGAFINLCTPGIELFIIGHQGNWLPLSVTPSILLPLDEYMSFFERLINPWASLITHILYKYTALPLAQNTLEEYFPDMPPIQSLYESSHVTLINGHFALDGPAPLLPTQVEVGAINAKPPKPLPKDLEEFVNESGEAGVIYFSLGSIAKANDMPQQYKITFLEAFSKIPQRVIWKYEGTDLTLPSNVITRKWLPQQDILGHPKTRIFISHCGNLGTQEAKYHGVPVLAVPIAFDQPRNAARMARKGYGLVVNWDELTTVAILEAIQTLLHDPSYAARLKQVSEALKDQKESPGERAVWWIEYAIRQNGRNASHLEYAGRRLHFLQYIMVDVAAFWIVTLTLWTVFCYCLCAKGYRCCCGTKKKNNKKRKLN